ncbi:MAG: PilZ domain-containing protein [Deltaproteobacteria bacterium]|nr:PilZ domain-containing protein [Deltaproteobacteria bacterium]
MGKTDFSERRQHRRTPLDLDIEVSQVLSDNIQYIEDSVCCKCRDISCGGISFYSMNSFPLHSILRLHVLLDDIDIKVMGKVMWEKQLPAASTFVTGVQFLNIYEHDFNMLCSYIMTKCL